MSKSGIPAFEDGAIVAAGIAGKTRKQGCPARRRCGCCDFYRRKIDHLPGGGR